MAVTVRPPVYTAPGAVMIAWASDLDEPTFYVYRNGRFVGSTPNGSGAFNLRSDEPMVLDVFDDPAERPEYAASPIAELRFAAVADGERYPIERLVDGEWELEQLRSTGGAEHRHRTGPISEDGATFRVTAILPGQGSSSATEVTANIVRHPDGPDVDLSYDNGTNVVTVSAA